MKLKRVIAIACTAAMTASLISGCGGSSDEGRERKASKGRQKEQQRKICLWQNIRRQLQYIWAGK